MQKQKVSWDADERIFLAKAIAKIRIGDISSSVLSILKNVQKQLPKERQRPSINIVPDYITEDVLYYIRQEYKNELSKEIEKEITERTTKDKSQEDLVVDLERIFNTLPSDVCIKSIVDSFSYEELIEGINPRELINVLFNRAYNFADKVNNLIDSGKVISHKKQDELETKGITTERTKSERTDKSVVAIFNASKGSYIQNIQSKLHKLCTIKQIKADQQIIPDADIYVCMKFGNHSYTEKIKKHAYITGKKYIFHRGGVSSLIDCLVESLEDVKSL